MTSLPHPEHPTPNFQRERWINLNGAWRFCFDPDLIGEQMGWYRPNHRKELTITVPYPWESRLSGVTAADYKGAGWYAREITIPADWEGLVPVLHFGAVDWQARVWINGRLVAEHENGYLPFAVDLRPYARPGETVNVTVRAFDVGDAATLVGKQVPRWYTFSSGIWQTVWLEARTPDHIDYLRVDADLAGSRASLHLTLHIENAGDFHIEVASHNGDFASVGETMNLAAGTHEIAVRIPIADSKLWSPESPFLYDFTVTLTGNGQTVGDAVQSYFGLRTVGRCAWNGKPYEYITLNGEPVYLRGALDQAFHPDGLHTYPSDDAVRADIQLAKDLGLNMLRCHIKINDPRYYYWADRLGLLILYDIPSADIDSPSMRRIFEETVRRALHRDGNSPSIIAWIIFNETWGLTNHNTLEGQQWVKQMTDLARQLDPSRLVEDNSPNKYDHVDTDINSWHFYINDYEQARQHVQLVVDETYPGSSFNYVGGDYVQKTAPLINSEYAGISARMGDLDIAWSFKYLTSDLRRHDKICGYVYTELADIEWEHNGFVNYDRSAKEFGYDFFVDGMTVADLNAADFVGVDAPPCVSLKPGDTWRLPLFVSHWGAPLGQGRFHWRLDLIDTLGKRRTLQQDSIAVRPERFDVLTLDDLSLTLPETPGVAVFALWLEDEDGAIRCRNYVNALVGNGPLPSAEQTEDGWILRFDPADWQRLSNQWPRAQVVANGGKFAVTGSGWVEYRLPLPPGVVADKVKSLSLRFEAAARADNARVDWPQRVNGNNYPQTEVNKKHPSDLVVSLNGIEVGRITLPDDPADARGVLSHHRGIDPGAYGYLHLLEAKDSSLAEILEGSDALTVRFEVPADAHHRGGLSLYGRSLGANSLDPTIVFTSI